MRIGAHMSAAGGVTRAVERAVLHECEALQIFTKNNARWIGKAIGEDEARRFRDAVAAAGLAPVVSHASYLINLAAVPGGSGSVRDKSIDALVDELERARLLDLLGVVVHPGVAAPGASDDEAIALVGEAIRAAFARLPGDGPLLLLEHTAGQGRSIGHRFEHLAAILERLDGSPRVGICLDTCHLLAAGYDIASDEGYADTIADFDRIVGLGRLTIIHANDSKRRLGSRLDRHEHIGEGFVGLDGFRRLLHDPRLAHLAMVIETHKTPGVCDHPKVARHDPLDHRNLKALRKLREGCRQG
jgi:deoxyribonuclease-4